MTLDEFLKQDKNSVFREKLINYRFFYEIKLEAAKRNSDIEIFIPEIDRNGFDVILDDSLIVMPYQLKVSQKSSKTSEWEITKNLIRPKPYYCSLLGYEESPEGEGTQGGFILIIINIENEDIKDYEYYYTDCFILKALEEELLVYKNKNWQQTCERIINGFKSGNRYEKVKMKKCSMVKVSDIDKLLALSDICSRSHNQWKDKFIYYLKNKNDSICRKEVVDSLKELIQDKRLKF